MAALAQLRTHWRACVLNLIFIGLLLGTHTFAYSAEFRSGYSGSVQLEDGEVGSGELRLLNTRDGSHSQPVKAQLLDTRVDVKVHGMIARVIVRQRFSNPAQDWAEAEYLFPLPTDSAVDYMAMTIGERRIVGEIREREAAKRLYEAARDAGQQASLLSQQRTNLFRNRVANIPPGAEISVELHYVETVRYDQGRFSLRVPTTLTPRYIPGYPQYHPEAQINLRNGSAWAWPTYQVPDAHDITPPMVPTRKASALRLTASIDAGVSLDSVSSLHHAAQSYPINGVHHLELTGQPRLDRDVVLEWQPQVHQAPVAAAFAEQIGEDFYTLLMLMPPQRAADEMVLSRETIFVIDTSGSMAGESIQQAKQALISGLQKLRPGDRFNVLEFNSQMQSLWLTSQPVDHDSLLNAIHFVENLVANGGTEMKPALAFALSETSTEDDFRRDSVRQVIFITDGSVGNEAELFDIIERRRGNSRLFTVGIGSAPNSHFMEKAATAGRGSYTYIASQHQISTSMDELFSKLQSPLVTDLVINTGAMPFEMFPRRLPDLYLGEPLLVALRFQGKLPGELQVSGRRNGQDFHQRIVLPQRANARDIGKVWARGQLTELYDRERAARFSGASSDALDDLKTAITDLALQHQLLSSYTSFVAVDETPVRPASAPLRHQAIPNAMPRGNTMAIPLPSTALGLKGKWLVALVALFLLVAVHLWGKHRHA